ncbi:MAG TPA: hypothetical protein VF456_16385 [Vicinamibacterales bacterium]
MKPIVFGLIFVSAAATAYAQVARPILPPPPYGPVATGTLTVSGCVTGGGVGAGPFAMLNPKIVPSTIAPESIAGAARPVAIPPISITPMHLPPDLSYSEPGAVGTAGTSEAGYVGTAGVSPTGFLGYRLTGSDMTSWVGRRVQVSGTPVPLDPETMEAIADSNAPYFQDFNVESVVPLTGACPRP